MKKILMLGLVAVVMFGVSAAGSWKWRQIQLAQKESSSGEDETAASTSGDSAGSQHASAADHSPRPGAHEEPAASSTASLPERRPAPRDAAQLPLAVRPTYTAGVEETVQLAAGLRDRAAAVREREVQLASRQKQLELVYEDIRSERAAIDELRNQVSDELKAVEEQLAAAERDRAELDLKQQTIDGRVTQMDDQEKDNIKKMGGMYDSMAPESAAKILQQMTDSGNMDTAVKLLGVMKERQAAKVLAEMQDATLAAQLSEKLKGLKRPTAAKK
jgi:flagellar motility protein MotE (MotC chaperone)